MTSRSKDISTGGMRFLFLALAMVAVAAAFRIPFLSNILIGEEGSMAFLVLGAKPIIQGLDAMVAGRIDGIDRLIFPEHNILMYKFLDIVGRGIGQLLPLCRDGSIDCTTVEARSPFLVLFLMGTAITMLAVRKWLAFERPFAFAVQLLALLYVISAPLIVGGSIQPQIDGALGVLVVATAAAFLLATDVPRSSTHLAWASLAGIALVVGKNEWALALAAAVFIVVAMTIAFSIDLSSRRFEFAPARNTIKLCGIVLAGIAAGQLLNFLYSPEAYPATFDVMRRVDAMKLSGLEQLKRTWGLSYPIFLICAVALAPIGLRLKHYCLNHPMVVIVAGWGATIVLAYAYSGFSGDGLQRYYCPAGILACVALVCVIRDLHLPRPILAGAAVALAAGLVLNSASLASSYSRELSISSSPGLSIERVKSRYAALAKAYTGAPILEWSPIGVYYRNVDWIAGDLGEAGAVNFVRQYRPGFSGEFLKIPW